jgi:inner membrane protein
MDNLTHSLIGAMVAATVARVVPLRQSVLATPLRRQLCMALLVVGSNAPDLDLLYTSVANTKLDYLLHHRGHTHTLIGVVLIALLLWGLSLLWLRWRQQPTHSSDRRFLLGSALLGPLLHIVMDAANSYGVHPFWPLNSRWFYGDAIFIVEPLFWACAAPLVFLFESRPVRVLIALIMVLANALSYATGLVPLPLALCLSLLTVGLLFLAWRSNEKVAALSGCAAMLLVYLLFNASGMLAKRQVATLLAAQAPNAQLLDSVLTPMPVNPLCWDLIAVQRSGDQFTLRHGMLALQPSMIAAADCPQLNPNAPTTIALSAGTLTNNEQIHWQGEVSMSVSQLQSLVHQNCEAAAFTQFARALWLTQQQERWVLGDLRFDREAQLSFAEVEIGAQPQACPRFVPPWLPPRGELLK